MSFGDRIKELRIEKGLTQEQLGHLVGVSRVSIGFYESGRMPPLNTVRRLAEALAVPLSYLIHNSADEDPEVERYEAAFEELEIAGFKCAPAPGLTAGNVITLDDGMKVHASDRDIIQLVETVLAEAEKKKQTYIKQRLAAELCMLDEYTEPEEDPTFEKY